ncbi:MAG: hypothetical protein DMG93_19850 [Acidobacteria bacterium]|nr:MAG: hypothetical protein DMG93_19850 [Acidobacteriota bacterium]
MSNFVEVSEPILNSPFEKPKRYWYIREGEEPELRPSSPDQPDRRPAMIFPPKDQREVWTLDGTILRPSKDYPTGFELGLVNVISLGRPRTASGSTTLPLPAPGISREHTIKVTYHLYELR